MRQHHTSKWSSPTVNYGKMKIILRDLHQLFLTVWNSCPYGSRNRSTLYLHFTCTNIDHIHHTLLPDGNSASGTTLSPFTFTNKSSSIHFYGPYRAFPSTAVNGVACVSSTLCVCMHAEKGLQILVTMWFMTQKSTYLAFQCLRSNNISKKNMLSSNSLLMATPCMGHSRQAQRWFPPKHSSW